MKTVNLTPTWKAAVRIYCAVLQNENAEPQAKRDAELDLLELANAMDEIKKRPEMIYYVCRDDSYWNGHAWRRKEFAIGFTETEAHELVNKRFKKIDAFVRSVQMAAHLHTTQVKERLI